jgi:hypothetical protein
LVTRPTGYNIELCIIFFENLFPFRDICFKVVRLNFPFIASFDTIQIVNCVPHEILNYRSWGYGAMDCGQKSYQLLSEVLVSGHVSRESRQSRLLTNNKGDEFVFILKQIGYDISTAPIPIRFLRSKYYYASFIKMEWESFVLFML